MFTSSFSSCQTTPRSKLLKAPFVRVRIIEAKDVYLIQGNRKDFGDLYARVGYGTDYSQKTHVIPKSSSPKWGTTWEFRYYPEDEEEERNVISISIYDADPLGSDELIATQMIPLKHFRQKNQFGKKLNFWVRLNNVNSVETKEQIFVETDVSFYDDLDLPEFNDVIINNATELKNSNLQKLHVELEIYNHETLKQIQVSIPEIEEQTKHGIIDSKVFLYTINIIRNDGLEWTVKKRYSQIRALRDSLVKEHPEFGKLYFPGKSMLKFTSRVFSNLDKDFRKICLERRKGIEDFLNAIASLEKSYRDVDFINFFTSEDDPRLYHSFAHFKP